MYSASKGTTVTGLDDSEVHFSAWHRHQALDLGKQWRGFQDSKDDFWDRRPAPQRRPLNLTIRRGGKGQMISARLELYNAGIGVQPLRASCPQML